MEPGPSPCFTPAWSTRRLVLIESAPIAEDVAEPGQRGADGEHLLGHRPEVCLAEVFNSSGMA